jgi:predicted transcriptional regulator YdeE
MRNAKPRIIWQETFQVAGIPLFGNPREGAFRMAWHLFGLIADETPWMRQEPRLYGVQIYPPKYPNLFEFIYLAGIRIAPGMDTPIRCVRKDLPASDYAVFEAKGGVKGIDAAYGAAYRDWLPSSKYIQAFPYDFEQYDGFSSAGADPSSVSIWIPVKARK